jgi:hypothetical protein
VTGAEHRGGYRIHVQFNDKTAKTIDFGSWLEGPIFEPLKDLDYFRKFFLDGGTIAWPNGADIAPETLYEYDEPPRRVGCILAWGFHRHNRGWVNETANAAPRRKATSPVRWLDLQC